MAWMKELENKHLSIKLKQTELETKNQNLDGNLDSFTCRKMEFFKKLKFEKIPSRSYSKDMCLYLAGSDLTISYLQLQGFKFPIFVPEKEGLGIKIPHPKTFKMIDIRKAIGSRKLVNVINMFSLKQSKMTLKDWHKYFDEKPSSRISTLYFPPLEISNTKLSQHVIPPKIVREIDWIDKVWPSHLRETKVLKSSNMPENQTFPCVQKYIIMAVEDCWTEFHIEMGGASSWYHVSLGIAMFWLIPPTQENIKIYEDWIMSKDTKSCDFFGDRVADCQQFELSHGGTILIPSGWIIAIYYNCNTILYSGRFLHSFNMIEQLQVAFLEQKMDTKCVDKFPFFTEILWYTLDRYLFCLTGKTHLDLPHEEKEKMLLEKGKNIDPDEEAIKLLNIDVEQDKSTSNNRISKSLMHLSLLEIDGIKSIIMYLHSLPYKKNYVPIMLQAPDAVITDLRYLIDTDLKYSKKQGLLGKYALKSWSNDPLKSSRTNYKRIKNKADHMPLVPKVVLSKSAVVSYSTSFRNSEENTTKQKEKDFKMLDHTIEQKQKNILTNRVRCNKCEGCKKEICLNCNKCTSNKMNLNNVDMGLTCEKRKCKNPQLSVTAYCSICKLDGWMCKPVAYKTDKVQRDPPNLFECISCQDITHPQCAEKFVGSGEINPDLTNSWLCRKCVDAKGKRNKR